VNRESELRQIVAAVRPAVVVSVLEHRGFRHAELFEDLLRDLALPAVKVLLGGERQGWQSWESLGGGASSPAGNPTAVSPALLLFTSGTTSAPKAVVHTHRSLLAEASQVTRAWSWSSADVSHVATPLAHVSGLVRGVLGPLMVGGVVRTRQRWDPELVVDDLATGGVTLLGVPGIGTSGALLGELLDVFEGRGAPPHSVRLLVATGPRGDLERADALGFCPGQHYGMSELPTITVVDPADPFERRVDTAGRVGAGVELRVVDDAERTVDAGVPGEIEVRGPEQMSGYLSLEDDGVAWTDDGWLRTGDIGAVADSGYLSVTGRTKDIINRGGEKFSALEIEEHLARHPEVREVAVVPAGDRRLGEVPAAFVVWRDGQKSGASSADLERHLAVEGLARQKVPVRWEFVDRLPRTASGKVKKGELTAQLS
jgi:acyl-CoA synthetase